VRVLLTLLLLCLLLPLLFFGRVGEKLANHRPAAGPEWSLANWWSGGFQTGAARRLNEQFGARNTLVRWNNQKDYSIFNHPTARDVVIGKDDYLFEDTYLEAATGGNYQGRKHFDELGGQLRSLRDSLTRMNVDLLVMMAAGKGSYFPEFHPEPYASRPPARTNEEELLRVLQINRIDHLNFNAWFRDMKSTTAHPLFPKLGIHWTKYGQYLVMDSLINYLEINRQMDMPDLMLDSLEISPEQRGTEADIYLGMNLFGKPAGYPLAYPHWRVENPDKPQPKVLVVGDSFYWSLYLHQGLSDKFFAGGDFWYYFNRVMRGGQDRGAASELDLKHELAKYDLVILWETESHYHRLSNGFLKAALRAFAAPPDPATAERELLKIVNEIRAKPEWLAYMQEKALARNQPLDTVVWREARYVFDRRE